MEIVDAAQEFRDQYIAKANTLIQQSRFSLTVQQQRIIMTLLSQISPIDDDFKRYEFDIIDFCRAVGIDDDNGKNYKNLKDAIKALADKSIWITKEGGKETLLRWIEKADIDHGIGSGKISIRLDADMKPFLLHLQKNFTRYAVIWTLRFKSKYSFRLYEIAQSIHYHKEKPYSREYQLDELCRMMGASDTKKQSYQSYQNFKAKALEPAVKEINLYSDKNVKWEPIKTGKKVTGIRLTVSTKPLREQQRIRDQIDESLGLLPGQVAMWESIREYEQEKRAPLPPAGDPQP